MSNFRPPVTRRNHGRGHSYVDANGAKVPGVTTIIGDGVPKPALVNWASRVTAAYAVDHWDELAELPPSERLAKLEKARYEDRDTAGNRGTQVHKLAQRALRGEDVGPVTPEELRGHVEAYIKFLDEWDVEEVLSEFVVVSHRHGYAGTADLIADLIDPDDPANTVRWLLDVKTARSGVFGETALQLAGYRYADHYVDHTGVEQPMIPVDRAGVVHVRADGYSLVPVEAGPWQHRQLLYAQQVKVFCDDARDLVGEALDPPVHHHDKEASA